MKAPPFPPPPTLYSRDVSLSLSLSTRFLSSCRRRRECRDGTRRRRATDDDGKRKWGGEKEGTLKTRLIQVGEGWKRRRRKRKR